MALPVLMHAMKRNASTSKGAEGLLSALNTNHNGSILNNLSGLFGGGVDTNVLDDGGKILRHVLGGKQQHIEQALGANARMDASSFARILEVAASILMGILGKQARQQKVSNSGDIENLLGGLFSDNSSQQEHFFLESILDSNGDSSVIDDGTGMVLGDDKKKGRLGGILGGLFDGK